MTKQAIIYTRFSPRPNAKECDSCEKQKERCEAYCADRKYEVISVLVDENLTGGDLNRPGIIRALDYLSETRDRILVVDSSNRLARDMLVNLTIRHQVEQAGATIEFADGSPPDTTPEGKLFQNILAAFAAYERDRIREKTRLGLERKRKNSERISGEIPIGWQLDPENPKRLVRCEQEREAIIEACCLPTSSESIAEILTARFGLCRGKPWSARTVRKIIAKHSYWADPIDGDLSLEPRHP